MLISCSCKHCNGHVEFDPEEFTAEREVAGMSLGQTIDCPHCGQQTTLYMPKKAGNQFVPPPLPHPETKAAAVAQVMTTKVPHAVTAGQVNAILAVLIAGLLVFPIARSAFTKIAPPQWEYMVQAIPDASFTLKMDEYGRDGWELVFARRASDGNEYLPKFNYEVIFKRPKQL